MNTKQNSNWLILLKGFLMENPVFVLVLGTCPTLGTTKDVGSALGMGVATLLVLICSNVLISMLRKVIPENVRIPCYIVIISGFVTIVQLLIKAFLPALDASVGDFISLITVNCIILGRAEMFASKNGVGKSALDGLGMGIGFTLALISMALVREVFGNATFTYFPGADPLNIGFLSEYKIPFLQESPGGLMVYGLLIALVSVITKGKFPKKKSFSCEGCPSAGMCRTGACQKGDEQ